MDAELKRRVDALRRPLELAAADGFAGVRKVQGLGHALRAACDGVLARLPDGEAFTQWRTILARWEQLDEQAQAVEVARGMRLLARFPRAARPAPVTRADPRGRRASPAAEPPSRQAESFGTGRVASGESTLAPPEDATQRREGRKAEFRATRRDAPAETTHAPSEGEPPRSPRRDIAAPTPDAALPAVTRPPRSSKRPRSTPTSTPTPRPTPTPIPSPTSVQPDSPTPTKRKRAPAPSEPIDPLAAPTHTLPGIGPAFAERLAEKGLVTVEDLLWMVPRRYDDVRDAKTLAEACALEEGARCTFVAQVASARMIFARGRRWAEVRLGAIDLTAPATALVRWFNVFAIDKRMPPGCQVALSGVIRRRGGRTELANPDILGIEIEGQQGKGAPAILARYPDVAGVPPARLRSACAAACARVGAQVDDGVPASIEQASGMPSLGETLTRLHAPPADIAPEELAAMNRGDSRWQRRLAFGELFALGVAITQRRRARRHDAAVPCGPSVGLAEELARTLPFALTGAQRRTIDELWGDLARAVPMNRLLQGDVGAGKTAVAFAAALAAARAGRQAAVMAPTELLAEQHMDTWRAWAKATGLRVELLTASTPKGIRQSLLALLAAGETDVVIGTHSLLAESVGFSALGLVVIDEQHRFGVAQRARLRDKGDGQGAPHLLVMTATPIPRTLALTAYGDLDASVLDEMPPGRQPVATTRLAGARGRKEALKVIAERVAAGERAYVVCPKVEPSDDGDVEGSRDWADATTTADELARALPAVRVGLVHGRLDSGARDRVMRAFKAGELDVLVATTVIEVGVDVPAATVIVIHDAERFGLAQLHQLRGRVGRGGGASRCLLLSAGELGPDAEHRLSAMTRTHDGFEIAEYDLSLRGPGELLGPRQAGVPRLRYGDLAQHTALLLEARHHAERLLDEDPGLTHPANAALGASIARRFARQVYGAESG